MILLVFGILIGLFIGWKLGKWFTIGGLGRAEIRTVRRKLGHK